MNVVERLGAKYAWGRVLKMFPTLRRWLPLLAVLGLATTTILRAVGKAQPADALDFALKLVGLVVSDPEVAAATIANAGAGFKLVKLLIGLVPTAPPTAAVVALLSIVGPNVADAEMRMSAIAGGLASLQPAPAESSAAVTPLVQLAVEADTAKSAHAPKLVVLADLTALPGEQLDLQDPATYRALELSVGLAQPLGDSLRFRIYAEAGFATRLPGDTQPRDRTARWASLGLRFAGEHAWLQVGVGPDQRLGARPEVLPAPDVSADPSPELAPARNGYQAAITVRGSVDITSLGERGRVALVGSAVLGLDLSRRWASLDGGRGDVVRLGVAVGL